MQAITSTSLQDLLRGGAVPYSLLISPTFGDPITVTSAEDVLEGSFYVDRRSSDGDVLQIGNTTVGELGVTLINHDGRFNSVTFEGATAQATYQLKGEQLTGGSFVIDERPKKGVLLELKALDKMARFNRPYTSGVTAGQTLAQAIQAACAACDVVMSTDPIPNGTYQLVGELEADQQYTWRQILSWLLQLAPCNAYIGPTGRLNFGWYDNTATPFELADTAVWDSSVAEKNIQVTGIVYVQKDGAEKIAGTDDYALELSGNPFVEADVDACLAKIHAKINGLTFRPMTLDTLGFPHLWPMDLAHVTLGGVTYQTYFTHVRYGSRDGSTLESKSVPKEIKDYAVGAPLTQAQRIAVHNLVERYKESALNEIELGLAQLNEDMAVALGYYPTTIETVMPDSSISRKTYLHDKPTLEESMVILLLGGPSTFAWTTTGWNEGNPAWEYGLGPQGNLVMQIINAYKIGAHLIILSDSTTAQQAFDAAVTVFRDIPSPPYKQGDLWHMPELTVNYWLNCGLTVDQVMALGFTVEERMGGNSYVCVNNRASGNFTRSDWELTGATDKTSAKLSQRITTNTNTITEMGMQVTQVTEDVQQVAEDLENIELTPGPSAYEVAVAAGFEGTEAEWLASLVGDDGQSQWTYLRYSANADGNPMTDTPDATTKYIGIAVTTSSTAPTEYSAYTWQKFVGEDGQPGVPGNPGLNGTTYYTWIKYADTPTTGMSDAPAGKDYIGIAHNKTTATESTDYSDYSWSKIKGDPGTDGDDGTGITSVVVEYAIGGTTEPTSGWTTTPPATWGDSDYLWTRYKITYTDSTVAYTGANRLSDVEAQRVLQKAKDYADQITPRVFTDIPQPPYKVGDLWHMPELTVDYWLICGLTVDQVIALNFTVEERLGGNSYVCTNARATGTFNHADWQLTGSTDKATSQIERRITTNEANLTSLSLEISEVTEVVYEHSSEITTAKTNIAELTASSLTISENLEVGGMNLVTNPTFGTSQMAEKTGWSSEYVMQVLLDRFRGKTMNEMFATLAGKTINDIMTYNF